MKNEIGFSKWLDCSGIVFFLAFFTMLVVSPHLISAEADSSSRMESLMEEVIVTSRKREESMQDAPLSVSAFSGDSLEARGLTNISEVGGITPNLTYQNNPQATGSSSVSTVYIRGVGQRDSLGTLDNGVGFYIDDVYIARTVGAVVDLLDVERIEVLRGPQGTLFGRNNVGGALALHSKKPSDEFGGYVSAAIGVDNEHKLRGTVNIPLSDNLLTSFSGIWHQQDGYVKRPAGGDLGNKDVSALRANVLWLATDTIEVSFSADYSTEDNNGAPFKLVGTDEADQASTVLGNFVSFYNNVTQGANCGYGTFGPFNNPNPLCYNDQWVSDENLGDAPTFSKTDVWGTKLGVTWDISDELTFKSITAYRDLDAEAARDSDASPLLIVHFYDRFKADQFSQEFQLLGTAMDNKLDWITGAYYFDEKGYNRNELNFAIAHFDSRNHTSSTSMAVFTQGTYHLTDSLDLTLGVRYTDEEKTFDPDQVVLDSNIGIPGGTMILPLGKNSRDTQETTPMANIAYNVNDDTMVYATYSEGFRSGGYVQRIFPPRPDVVEFDPEYVKSYELGFKFNNSDGSLSLNGATFFMDYEDIQVRVPAGVAQVEQNVGEAEISGAELELKWQPAASWFVEAGVGYTHAKYTKIIIDVSAPPTADPNNPYEVIQLDNEFDHVPEWSVNASLSKEFDLDNNGLLLIRLSGNYQSGYFNEPLNLAETAVPEIGIFDLTTVWTSRDETYSLRAGIKNFTDEEYNTAGYFNPSIGTVEHIEDRGAQWFISGQYNF